MVSFIEGLCTGENKEKDKGTENDLQNIIQKTNDKSTRTPLRAAN